MRPIIRNLPFKIRIFLGCFLVALIPLLFSGIFMVRIFDSSLRKQTSSEMIVQLEDIQVRLNEMLDSCESACQTLTEASSVYRVLIDNSNIDFQKDLYLLLYPAVQETYSHARFSIYDAGGMLRFSANTTTEAATLPTYWGILRKAADSNGLVYYRTDPYLVSDPAIVFQAACVVENEQGVRAGYIVLDFTQDSLNRLFNGHQADGDVLVLLDTFGEAIYCSNPDYEESDIDLLLAQSRSPSDSERLSYYSVTNPEYGYTLLLQKNSQISSPAIGTMNTLSTIIALVCLGLCLVISLALSRGISQPVRLLDQAMQDVRDGDLSVRINSDRKDELGRLSDSFDHMTGEIKEHIEMAIQKQKDLNEKSLQLYQAQLNPHFLYNTLDTIRWTAKIEQNPEIPILAENLAQILRRSISTPPFVTLKEELETISYYLEIQKIRFSERFLYEEEVPDQLEQCLVPKMILQPLVENAVIHGLDGCRHGYICIYAITAETEGPVDTLKISVTDNGCGINTEMLDWINSSRPQKHDGHLGLYNIIQILKLYYGEDYGLHAELNPDGGTTVTISLPCQRR